MKIRQLIAQLQALQMDDADVYCHAEAAEETIKAETVHIIHNEDQAPYTKSDSPLDPRYFNPKFPVVIIYGN